tara:strand:- start:645 stop:2651 length:2007 start_codon:yes stop_codon:yes gene_type:complete
MNKKIEAALGYAKRGLYVFPLKANQKIPATRHGYKDATIDQDRIISCWGQRPDLNIGMALNSSNLVAIDVDSYKSDCKFDEFIQGRDMPPTLIQNSANGGTHYIFKCNSDDEFAGQLCTGVDIKSNGYIVVEPSTLNGKKYTWATNVPPAEAPSWIPRKGQKPKNIGSSQQDILSGADYHVPLRDMAFKNSTKGMPAADNIAALQALMQASAGPRDARWHDRYKGIPALVQSADQKIAAGLPDFVREAAINCEFDLVLNSAGRPVFNHHNAFEILCNTPQWAAVFAYDEFAMKKMVIHKPPFETGNPDNFKPRELRESDITGACRWLNRNGFITVTRNIVADAIQSACEQNIISPVKHYLENLAFTPGIDPPQLEHWFEKYLGVVPAGEQERKYVRAVAKLSLIQAVARALSPGCKADTVVIFEGPQGIGKSTALRELHGSDWFGDSLPPMGHKDASDYIRGKWGVELAEMSFQKKSDIELQKAFISRQEERFRPVYAREEISYPRRCVFWGTTNRDDYLKDETGNRRFLPVKTDKIDIAGLKANRDALWAEAVHLYRQGEKWWLDDDLLPHAEQQANQRFECDPWVEIVHANLAGKSEISVREAFEECFPQTEDRLGIAPHNVTPQMSRRMGACLRQAGWERAGKFTNGLRRNQNRFVQKSASEHAP